ncbi:hypothetical protein ACH5RR_031933 [Cinchona calisaya]|uniref:Amino acid transporter transmembrane domain-containing protein n=1 Tax=Cinchona calisaya TaxID=153742 RepID=A0ABD2YI11_9GENT
MVGEVGELSEVFQWKGEVPRGLPDGEEEEEEKQHLGEELPDVLLYLIRLHDICGIDLGKAVLRKLEPNALKYPVDTRTAEEKAIDDWLPITSSRNAKWWYSAFHNVTAMVGAGVLSLPYAMSELGWKLGIGVVAFSPLKKGFFASGPEVFPKFGDNDFRKVGSGHIQVPETGDSNKDCSRRKRSSVMRESSNKAALTHFSFILKMNLFPCWVQQPQQTNDIISLVEKEKEWEFMD